MAIRPQFVATETDQSYFMFSTGEAGGVVCSVTGLVVRGNAADDPNRRAFYPPLAEVSGSRPLGILVSNVVNLDLTRQRQNVWKPSEKQVGDKVEIVNIGTVTTNFIGPGQASGIAVPADAFAGPNGRLYSNTAFNTASGWPRVGRFLTTTDADGYAQVRVNL